MLKAEVKGLLEGLYCADPGRVTPSPNQACETQPECERQSGVTCSTPGAWHQVTPAKLGLYPTSVFSACLCLGSPHEARGTGLVGARAEKPDFWGAQASKIMSLDESHCSPRFPGVSASSQSEKAPHKDTIVCFPCPTCNPRKFSLKLATNQKGGTL